MRARKKRAGASPTKESVQESEVAQPELAQKMEFMMGQMMAGMQQLESRLVDLETKQQQPKNAEDNISQEATPSQDSFKMVYSAQGCPWPMEDKKPGPAERREHA